ncbi:SurA N-terminal domain-containing protein [Nocardioides sp. TRM66260-LWL]|uniref:SurA N-terminal domain-containing protein n=1 Tax=Nocardioides sp. TRM66260-LWL TaxID=2874478 RepID=UPI001CC64D80|nr:SurA N-terminal domain-containing protein [Nocardioides sp. TRM66260-LWL]MBZ5736084.1 SurA N-terminal domain-containing protein [Nocardioides sp. TRM66260-LWL]
MRRSVTRSVLPSVLRSSLRPAVAATALGLLAASTTGCGVSDRTLRPGVAAVVDGTTISQRDVDDAAQPTCDVLRLDPSRIGPGLTGYQLRAAVLGRLTLKVIGDRVARENGVDGAALYRQVEDAVRSSLPASLPQATRDAATPVFAAGDYVNEVLDRAVTARLGASAPAQVRTAAGQQILANARAATTTETSPLFGPIDPDAAPSPPAGLSVPVSEVAAAAAAASPAPEAIAALPAEQRCTA